MLIIVIKRRKSEKKYEKTLTLVTPQAWPSFEMGVERERFHKRSASEEVSLILLLQEMPVSACRARL